MLCLAPACRSARWAETNPATRLWIEGPVRWLIQPDEVKEFRGLRNSRDSLEFIERFWRRRDPTPGDADNPYRSAFFERSIAADRLYGEGNKRGSLTDRGRVLILFGPPPILRYQQQAVPSLEPNRGQGGKKTRWMSQEVWAYRSGDLPQGLGGLLPEGETASEVTFVFASEARHTYLVGGDKYCELAARAAVVNPD